MPSAETAPEHFVTLFDRNFLAQALCLYRSLERQAMPFVLWALCTDDVAYERLGQLSLPAMRLLRLGDVETPALKRVRAERKPVEYYWTLTPFTPQFVMEREPAAARVTYLDADLYFFGSPRLLLDEMEQARAHVLITPHAYSPECDRSAQSGIYCVQFVTFRNTPEGRAVMAWWQDRCLEWCYDRVEDGRFGDQKYLDDWPQRFPGVVHALEQAGLARGPWNASRFAADSGPAFFHFHGLRRAGDRRLMLYCDYRLEPSARRAYEAYVPELAAQARFCRERWNDVSIAPVPGGLDQRLRRLRLSLKGAIRYAPFP